MAKISKEEAIRTVVKCAKLYERNLLDRTLLFILMDKHKKISSAEVSFYRNNFLHLTGLRIDKSKMSAEQFFERCMDGRLSERDFSFAEDGTTVLKLQILPYLMEKNLNANSFGDFGGNGIHLYTEKLAGGVKGCIGFIMADETSEWIPNTLLSEDIRKVSRDRQRIIATYRKKKKEETYREIVYCAKKIEWSTIQYPDSLKNLPAPKSDMENPVSETFSKNKRQNPK